MKVWPRLLPLLCLAAGGLGCALLCGGCEGDSGESIVRNLELDVTGFYSHPTEGSTLVSENTGAPITSLQLRQIGDQLEAVDNNNVIFKGTIGNASEDTASFTLEGSTTVGQSATIAGSISVPVGSSEGTMRGTWIEPSLFSTVYGTATVPTNPGSGGSTNGVDTNTTSDVVLTVTGTTIDIAGSSLSVGATASGGSGSYTWSLSNNSLGTLNATTGASVTYTANPVTGSQTITVRDSTDSSESDAETITQTDSGT